MIPFLLSDGGQSPRTTSRREDAAPEHRREAREDDAADSSPFARLLAEKDAPAESPKIGPPEGGAEGDAPDAGEDALAAVADAEAEARPTDAADPAELSLATTDRGKPGEGDPEPAARTADRAAPHLQTRGVPWAARLALAEAPGTATRPGSDVPTPPAGAGQAVQADAAAAAQTGAVTAVSDNANGEAPASADALRPSSRSAGEAATPRPDAPASNEAARSGAAAGPATSDRPLQAEAQPRPGEPRVETPRERRMTETPRERRVRDDRVDATPPPDIRTAATTTSAADTSRAATPTVVQPVDLASAEPQGSLPGDGGLELQAMSGPERTGTDTGPRPAAPGAAQPAATPRQIALAVAELGEGHTEIRLSPEELGRVRLTVSSNENSVLVQIAAERPETADQLRRAAEQLSRDLAELGYSEVSIEFQFGPGAGQRQPRTDELTAGPDPAPEPQAGARAPHPVPPGPRIAAGHLDIRL